MSWVKKRIKQYQAGQNPTFLEKMALEHGNPIHAFLAIVGVIFIFYGAWNHNYSWIALGVILNFLGHLYCWLQK